MKWRACVASPSDEPSFRALDLNLNAPIARATEFWWSESQPDARSLWDSKVELGQDFFNEIIRHPVPLDMHTLPRLQPRHVLPHPANRSEDHARERDTPHQRARHPPSRWQ